MLSQYMNFIPAWFIEHVVVMQLKWNVSNCKVGHMPIQRQDKILNSSVIETISSNSNCKLQTVGVFIQASV